jgi:hypothetical protein
MRLRVVGFVELLLGENCSPSRFCGVVFWFVFLFLGLIWVFSASGKGVERFVSAGFGLFWRVQVAVGFLLQWAFLE